MKIISAKAFFAVACISLILSTFVFAQNSNQGFRSLHIDAGKVTGEIRSFQGLNGQPTPAMAGLPNLVQQYKALRVNMVRTHDMMGPTDIDAHFTEDSPLLAWLIPDAAQRAGVVKAGNASIIFPNWNADPDKPESYNFKPTDTVIAAIHDSGAEVYYRVGRSWGAQADPPTDFDKYANVVKHVAMHYNQGWDHGFHYGIRYWEFWNEPEALFWGGTAEQFYSFYEKTARALKSLDPNLKVGGDARAIASDDGPYREGFIDYCAAHHVPLDFYSWHTYAINSADPYDGVRLAKEIRGVLDARGFTKAESVLSEWNLTPDFTEGEAERLRGAENAAFIDSALTYYQDAPLDEAIFYRGDAAWMGLFDLQGKFFKTAYAFEAMGKMMNTPRRLNVEGADTYGFAALAGEAADGKTIQILISNYAIAEGWKPKDMKLPEAVLKSLAGTDYSKFKQLPPRTDIVYKDNAGYDLTIDHLPWGSKPFSVKRYRISKTENLQLVEETKKSGESLRLANSLASDAVELIVLERR